MNGMYDGPERRQSDGRRECDCKHDLTIDALKMSLDELSEAIGAGQDELSRCKAAVDLDISTLHQDMAALRTDVSTMRADMHTLTSSVGDMRTSVGDMRTSLATIAEAVKSIADFPETWVKLKGFWAVLQWLKSNAILLAILVLIIAAAAGFDIRGLFP